VTDTHTSSWAASNAAFIDGRMRATTIAINWAQAAKLS
jgi:hypothetical protein